MHFWHFRSFVSIFVIAVVILSRAYGLPFSNNLPLFFDSEYSAECFNRRAFVSGFTGSAGTAVILKDEVSDRMRSSFFLHVCEINTSEPLATSRITE